MKNVLGPRIRNLRRRPGRRVTQQELAARLQAMGIDIDHTAISKLERGQRPISDMEFLAICKALGVKASVLVEDLP